MTIWHGSCGPAISVKQENWEKKREPMKDVCAQCHAKGFSDYNNNDSRKDQKDRAGAMAGCRQDGWKEFVKSSRE